MDDVESLVPLTRINSQIDSEGFLFRRRVQSMLLFFSVTLPRANQEETRTITEYQPPRGRQHAMGS